MGRSTEVENEGLGSVTEAKENLEVLANCSGASCPSTVLCALHMSKQ